MIRKPLLTFALVLCVLAGGAQNLNKPQLDSLLDAALANERAMGSLALMQNGSLVYSKATGIKASLPACRAEAPQSFYAGFWHGNV